MRARAVLYQRAGFFVLNKIDKGEPFVYNKRMERKIVFTPGEIYHIYTRGVEKRKIFLSDHDYFRSILLLYLANSKDNFQLSSWMRQKYGKKGKPKLNDLYELFKLPRRDTLVSIGVFNLMPNHLHILAREKEEGGISKFMGKYLTSLSMYFNQKNKRSGPLFTRPFRARHVDNDRYLKYLFAYIPLNPVKLIEPKWKEEGIKDFKKVKKYLENYKYSSYLDHLGSDRLEKNILNLNDFPDYFSNISFDGFINDWLKLKDEF